MARALIPTRGYTKRSPINASDTQRDGRSFTYNTCLSTSSTSKNPAHGMSSPKSPSRWKDYFGRREIRFSLPALSGQLQKLTRNSSEVILVHEVELFPGWATKRPRDLELNQLDAFDIVVHISGVATSRRTPELLTPPQRTFLKFAKSTCMSCHEEGRLKLPPRPYEIPDNFELDDLDCRFIDSLNQTGSAAEIYAPAQLKRLHDNLESRLRPFWASPLSSMPVQVSIFAPSPSSRAHHSRHPIITYELRPGSDGFFSRTIMIPWEDIRAHPGASRIANDKASLEHELLEWIPITHSTIRVLSDIDDTVKSSRVIDGARAAFHNVFAKDLEETVIPEMAEWYRALWKRGVRFHYVSNSPFELLPVVRQFIKISGLPSGSIRLRSYTGKSLFNGILSAPATRKRANVVEVLDGFPQSRFILIGDSGEQDMELYARLAAERPDQVAGVFIRDVTSAGLQDPTGTQAADVLGHLSRSPRTASIALVPTTPPVPRRSMTADELHSRTVSSQQPSRKSTFSPSSFPSSSKMARDEVSRDSLDSLGSGSFSVGSSTSPSSNSLRLTRRGTTPMTDGEKKQWDLQNRVYRARQLIPKHIPVSDPKECVEVELITEQLAELGARRA
ncbi:hypothetical protein BKA83DRAFT_212970 [Pisolithus microcarpus]|nr:hypothetical protein BKA83DRAFT_212970 [Pisolithus microcarpus]